MDKSLKFFLVEDDPVFVELLTKLLEAAGHRVSSESDSEAALAAIKEVQPDCLLIDLMMPGKDGLTLCKEIREQPTLADACLIVVSAKSYEFDRKRALKFGANGFIHKPISADSFVAEVERIVDDRIETTFWGVRGTLPVTGPGSLRFGGNTSCLTLEFARGPFFIFDAGSGIKALGDHLLASGRTRVEGHIFISHPHWDHINALPFFVPLYLTGCEFEILGPNQGGMSVREMISAQMDDIYFPITIREFGARVYFRDLNEGQYEVDGVSVRTMLLSHPGACLGYRIDYGGRSLCYITDNELYLPGTPQYNKYYESNLADFVRGTDALITDATYSDEEYSCKVDWGHSCVSRVVELAHQAEAQTLYLFHHDPDQDDDAIERKGEAAAAKLAELGSATELKVPAEGDKILI